MVGVALVQKGAARQVVGQRIGEAPAMIAHQRVDHAQADDLLQTLERAHDQRTVRPGTGIADVEVEAARLGLDGRLAVHGSAVGRDQIPKG